MREQLQHCIIAWPVNQVYGILHRDINIKWQNGEYMMRNKQIMRQSKLQYRILKMGFKIMDTLCILMCLQLIQSTYQGCWLSSGITKIQQKQLISTNKYEFSVHPGSGQIVSKQVSGRNRHVYFYGDLLVMRVYGQNVISIYQGIYMRVMPLRHQVSPWPTNQYQTHKIMELQVMFNFAFGKRQNIQHEEIGMSYFIAAANITNKTKQQQSSKLTKILVDLQKGKRINLQQIFDEQAVQDSEQLYLYRVKADQYENFHPSPSQSQRSCADLLWTIRKNLLQVTLKDFQLLSSTFHIQLSSNSEYRQNKNKYYKAKLRHGNEEQKKKEERKDEKYKEKQQQKQSNSCPENQQM